MADSKHSHETLVVVEQVDDPVGADSKRSQSTEPSPKEVTCLRLALEETESLDHSVGKGPVKVDDLLSGSSGKLDPAHLVPTGSQLSAEVVKRHDIPALYFPSPLLDGGHRLGVRQDLSRLLQRLVLIDRDEHGRRTTMAGDDDMLAQIGNLIDDLAQLTAKLADRYGLGHATSVPH